MVQGQPIECNICGMEGHMSRSCPNKDKCRLCGQHGHFARACTTPWNRAPSVPAPVDPVATDEAVSEAQTSAETPVTARSSVIMEAVSGEPIEEEEIFQDASEHSDSIEEFTSSASDAPSQASQSILRELPPTRAHEPPLAEEHPSVLVVSQSAPAVVSPLVETSGVAEGAIKEVIHQSPPVEETSSEIVLESPLVKENSTVVEEGSGGAAPAGVQSALDADDEAEESMESTSQSLKRKAPDAEGASPSPEANPSGHSRAKPFKSKKFVGPGTHSGLPAAPISRWR
ncbi:hypothetical protein OS493_016795 [Desmophyllum pertusum]|uniref:CCHC-type domain-containing protein n=1 Tax=Desmophyllum pertusum TaxID=174260 RepID=A0A9X0CTF3_9CNID|nr:hypothetical protein OS493_016795 [Desmophyllum pertusum]